MQTIEQKIREIVIPIIEAENAELIEIDVKGKPRSQIVRIFVDSENGIDLEKCTNISRLVSEKFDILDIFPYKYRLEVSSPGVNRPLSNIKDFKRNLNRDAEISYTEGEQVLKFCGKIEAVSDETVYIKSDKESKSILISKIKHGKISLPW